MGCGMGFDYNDLIDQAAADNPKDSLLFICHPVMVTL